MNATNVIQLPTDLPPCVVCNGRRYSKAHEFCSKCLNEGPATARLTGLSLDDAKKLDEKCRKIGAFTSMADLAVNSGNSYCPTVRGDK